MRQIILDTETTGLNPKNGDRIIEVAGVEMKNRRLTGRHLHYYCNPEREVDAGALAVHGITDEFLEDKPKFAQIAKDLMEFISGAELVIHNAPFDVGFLDMEFSRLDLPPTREICASVRDTLKMARELHPGKRNSLDALCDRYQISNAHRTLHGALLDAELLAEVYLAMTRGQESLMMDLSPPAPKAHVDRDSSKTDKPRPALLVRRANAAEAALHQQVLEHIQKESGGKCVWVQASGGGVQESKAEPT
ncbi:MAG: DNA polymerase III subunit epsilon [Zoogloeaceae bacterium]|jgi:DNA polymerase-3 subunit epsilon|nr:DNA polymerase III subunit epsilon [Zoogloeaceae bacterium]